MSTPPEEVRYQDAGLIPVAPRPSWRDLLADPTVWLCLAVLIALSLPVVVGFFATPPAPTP